MCLKGTLFTPLSAHNTSTQSLNVQLRKELDLHVNLVHGFNISGVPSRFSDVDVVVIRCGIPSFLGLDNPNAWAEFPVLYLLGVPSRFSNVDVVVIWCEPCRPRQGPIKHVECGYAGL